jgi:chromosome segregation ATPase
MKRFRTKVAALQSLRSNAGARVRQTQDRVQELTDRTETLRWRMQDEAHRQQSFASQIAHFRGMTSKIELDRELLTTDYSQVQSNHVDLTQRVNESNQRVLQSTEALQKKKVVESASVSEMLIELKQSKALWETHRQELLSAAKRHEDARISHGLGPTAPNCLPSLEMQHFGSLLDRETQATGSENTAKLDLTTQLAIVRHKLASLSKEQCTKKEALLQFTAQVEDTLKTAATRKEDATRKTQGFKDALDHLKELQSIHEAKLKQQGPSEELKSDSIREKISKLEKYIGRARTELADSASTLAVYRGARETASNEASQCLEEANCTNQKATACLAALLKDEEDTREGYYSEEGKRTKAEIDQIKSGECTTLRRNIYPVEHVLSPCFSCKQSTQFWRILKWYMIRVCNGRSRPNAILAVSWKTGMFASNRPKRCGSNWTRRINKQRRNDLS